MENKLTLGVDIERETDDANTALVISIKEDKVDITRLLLEEGADVHHQVQRLPPIVHAVMTNCAPQLIQLLIDHRANPNAVSGPDQMNALQWAAVEGKVDAVDFLASKGMDLNNASSKGRTPLILAAEQGHTTVSKLLLAKGAELLKRSDNSGTALAWAACNGHLDTVKYLLEEGIDVDDCDDCGLSKLKFSAEISRAITNARSRFVRSQQFGPCGSRGVPNRTRRGHQQPQRGTKALHASHGSGYQRSH